MPPAQVQQEIGRRLTQLRLSRNLPQTTLAQSAGVSVRTLRRLERGEPSTLDTFLRVAAALGLTDAILAALPKGDIRPIERVSASRRERKRARPTKDEQAPAAWSWGDEPND